MKNVSPTLNDRLSDISQSYAIQQRLRFIDFLVAHYGKINRSALSDYYGISIVQASHDLQDYMRLAPKNLKYDSSARTYIRSAEFVRVWK